MLDVSPKARFFQNLDPNRFPFGLGSDNHSGVHPRILKTLELANLGFAPSYGTDLVTEAAVQAFRDHFGPETEVHFCFNGTAANVLALAPLVRSHHAIVCTSVSHIHVDECAAPEKHLGTKLITVATANGKLAPKDIEPLLIRRGDQHFAQAKAVSITQPTELGTVYTRDELASLVALCRQHDLWLHIDGARFINAASALGCSLQEAAAGADSLSFGGTKNGLLFGEAVLFLSENARRAAREFPFVRKQMMQLPSKTRFIAAQFIELLSTELWQEIANHSRARARELRSGLEDLAVDRGSNLIRFTQPTESNAVFVVFERGLEKALKKSAFFYVWDEGTRECRLMTSWNTTGGAIQSVVDVAANYLRTASESQLI